MRRFPFFERDASPVPALPCFDVTCSAPARAVIAFGDSEGHVLLLARDHTVAAFRAHEFRVNAVAHVKGTDLLLTVGDGADSRPAASRNAARAAVQAARERERRARDPSAGGRGAWAGGDGGEEDAEGGGGGGEGGGAPGAGAPDLGALLGLGGGVLLDGDASALERGMGKWERGAVLSAEALAAGSGGGGGGGGGSGGGGGGGGAGAAPPAAAGAAPAPGGAVLKVWRLDRRDGRSGQPECLRTVRVFAGGAERVVTCLAASDDGSQAAVGCGDGALLLLRADFFRNVGGREGGGGGGLFGAAAAALGGGGGALGGGAGAAVKAQLLQAPPEGGGEGGAGAGAFAPGVSAEAITCLAYALAADPAAAAGGAAAAAAAGSSPSRGSGWRKGGGAPPPSRAMLCLFTTSFTRVRCYFPTET